MTARLLSAALLCCAAVPAVAVELHASYGQARIATEPVNLLVPVATDEVRVPGFEREVAVLSGGARFDLFMVVPISVSAFTSGTERFRHTYAPSGGLPEVDAAHSLEARGARIAFAPAIPLGNGWELDGALGAQYLEQEMTIAFGLDQLFRLKSSSLGGFAGAGVTWWPLPVLGIRAGVEVAEDYEALTVGARLGF